MHLLGAKVVPVDSGSATLKDAINEALRDWVASVDHTAYLFGTAAGRTRSPAWCATSRAASRTRPASSASTRSAGSPTRSPRAWAAARTRSACSRRSWTTRTWRSTASRPAATGSRPAATPRRSTRGAGRPARRPHLRARGRGRPDRRVPLDLGRTGLPRRRPPARPPRGDRAGDVPPVTDAEAMDALALLSRTEGIIPAVESARDRRRPAGGRATGRREGPRRHRADQPQRSRRQGHGHRHRVVRPG